MLLIPRYLLASGSFQKDYVQIIILQSFLYLYLEMLFICYKLKHNTRGKGSHTQKKTYSKAVDVLSLFAINENLFIDCNLFQNMRFSFFYMGCLYMRFLLWLLWSDPLFSLPKMLYSNVWTFLFFERSKILNLQRIQHTHSCILKFNAVHYRMQPTEHYEFFDVWLQNHWNSGFALTVHIILNLLIWICLSQIFLVIHKT